uniref:Uncharacterized protein MANES_01G011100 n=1 Tax=Rhizophora mucronata TaxID=61149 RepID=A0A2P2IRE5_RHIMU
MAGKATAGDGFSSELAGMTKSQLYDIMSQMKALIDQNKQQAREILVQNPPLTKALFQAQIMLGMVHSPQVIPNIQPVASQQAQQPAQQSQQSNTPVSRPLPSQGSFQDQTAPFQVQAPTRRQNTGQPAMPTSSASASPVNVQSQTMPPHHLQAPQQPKGQPTHQFTPISVQQSSQLPSIHQTPLHSTSQPTTVHQSQMPAVSSQLQQPLQTTAITRLPLQPPMSAQHRPHSMPSFHHQYGAQVGPTLGFQHGIAPQHSSQPMFHSGNKPQASMGPSFSGGQPHLPSQLPPHNLYQAGGSQIGTDFGGQGGSSLQSDRGTSWMSGPPDSSTMPQLPGPSLVPSQMGTSNQPTRTAPLTPEMEKALLQQVMSLTPEQINLLPPEQRSQVFQLQQMLRQ